jgi:vancomycin permeability regulator SanA
VIIVLGTEPLDESTPSLDMRRRVEKGVEELARYPDARLVFTGGKTSGAVSEARLMAEIASTLGVGPAQELLEEESRSTVENAELTAKLLGRDDNRKLILVTRPSHLPRALRIFERRPEFRGIEGVASTIGRQEIVADFDAYLAHHDRARTREVRAKVLAEIDAQPSVDP